MWMSDVNFDSSDKIPVLVRFFSPAYSLDIWASEVNVAKTKLLEKMWIKQTNKKSQTITTKRQNTQKKPN